jgi:hypothetical protein
MSKPTLLVVALLFLSPHLSAEPADSAGVGRWLGPEGARLPFQGDDQVLEFLRTADAVSTKVIATSTSRPLKVRLEKNGIEAHAIFRTIDKRRAAVRVNHKIYRDFHDSSIYECAAYEMSLLLGLDNVPPCVTRELDGKKGTLQLWVEGATTEKDRLEAQEIPPSILRWAQERIMMQVFDALIYNFDRNHGNVLVGADGKVWFVDHTRSFRVSSVIEDLDGLERCERRMWERMKALDEEQLKERLGPYLRNSQINALLKRRDKLVDHYQKLIDTHGDKVVLFDPPFSRM